MTSGNPQEPRGHHSGKGFVMTSFRFSRRRAWVAVALAMALLSACSTGSGGSAGPGLKVATATDFPPGTTMAQLAAAGRVSIGTMFDAPGFGLLGADGRPAGFDVEIAELVAAELGIAPDHITWKNTPADTREQALERGTVDLVVATYTINDQRKRDVSFAGPYYVAGQQIMTRADNTTITGPDSLRTEPGAKVCTMSGSTSAQAIRPYLASPSQLVTFAGYDKCLAGLRSGQVQALTTDNVVLLGLVSQSGGAFKMVGEPFTEEPYGIGIKKGDVAFCQFIDQTLRKAAADGAYQRAWTSTAGRVTEVRIPELPTGDTCR
jgi:glutamate transport system substrate-binding protein